LAKDQWERFTPTSNAGASRKQVKGVRCGERPFSWCDRDQECWRHLKITTIEIGKSTRAAAPAKYSLTLFFPGSELE